MTACNSDPADPHISFSQVEPSAGNPPRLVKPVRIAIASIVSPQKNIRDYERMLQYLGRKLDMPVEVVQRTGYSEAIALLENREVEVAFICSGPYVEARARFGAEALVVPQIGGKKDYRAYIIVRKNAPIHSFADLKGRVFAFVDPLSTTGKLYPAYLLSKMGVKPEVFFSKTIFTWGHDNSIEAVARGLADGAAVSSLVWDGLARSGASAAAETRVIDRSPPFGMPPVVVHPQLDPGLKKRLRDIFLSMHRDSEGKALLGQAGIGRFIEEEDAAYEGVRRMRAAVTTVR
ncbi:MAG: phosphate/phosphite/phosphonate ABC transporter substrate-binding protein [Elusimicrobia bacterium]|nr:phosphate/phosphite/phosphonate ABC transporter substrate-binding protein [Elusimicrobiota bacterium]